MTVWPELRPLETFWSKRMRSSSRSLNSLPTFAQIRTPWPPAQRTLQWYFFVNNEWDLKLWPETYFYCYVIVLSDTRKILIFLNHRIIVEFDDILVSFYSTGPEGPELCLPTNRPFQQSVETSESAHQSEPDNGFKVRETTYLLTNHFHTYVHFNTLLLYWLKPLKSSP